MVKKQKIVVLTGAGISAESGIATFRDANGLWENHAIEEVATPEGWHKNPTLVLEFYNQRRAQLAKVEPNRGHLILKTWEEYFDVHIITQNVDNLHERAGSSNITHLHGELTKARSTYNPNLVYDIGTKPLHLGDKCEKGSQLRPHIVWFGEGVPMIDLAIKITQEADILVIVGTSMQVYPAAGLIDYAGSRVPIYIIDPHKPNVSLKRNMTFIEEKGSLGLQQLSNILRPTQ